MTSTITTDLERHDLVNALREHRNLLLRTVAGLTDAQARLTPTASQLCLGGIIKHVALVEEGWVRFIEEGPEAQGPADEAAYEAHAAGFRMADEEMLADLIAHYEAAAQLTDAVIVALPSLDASHPLPEAPWFEPGAHWSARRALMHILAETAQHAGHADIIRETIDGAKSMG
jgi:uncharacterized damage-inducible protein DinB